MTYDELPLRTLCLGWVPEMFRGQGCWTMVYKDKDGKIVDWAYPTIERTTVTIFHLLPEAPKGHSVSI